MVWVSVCLLCIACFGHVSGLAWISLSATSRCGLVCLRFVGVWCLASLLGYCI